MVAQEKVIKENIWVFAEDVFESMIFICINVHFVSRKLLLRRKEWKSWEKSSKIINKSKLKRKKGKTDGINGLRHKHCFIKRHQRITRNGITSNLHQDLTKNNKIQFYPLMTLISKQWKLIWMKERKLESETQRKQMLLKKKETNYSKKACTNQQSKSILMLLSWEKTSCLYIQTEHLLEIRLKIGKEHMTIAQSYLNIARFLKTGFWNREIFALKVCRDEL